MKQRLISAFIALVILFLVLFFFETPVLNAAIALIILLALYELLHAADCVKVRSLLVVSCAYGAVIPFIPHGQFLQVFPLLSFCYIAALLLILIARHNTVSVLQIGFAFFMSVAVPLSITVAVYMRDQLGPPVALATILMALSGAWMSDTGAYFVGRSMGKHKLSPQISPKKTIEGAVGGVVVSTLSTMLISFVLTLVYPALFGVSLDVNYVALLLTGPILSVAGILGDLSASVIKRQMGIKDFGNIMPGHGGVMDRFDSVFFTAPTVFLLTQYLTFFTVR